MALFCHTSLDADQPALGFAAEVDAFQNAAPRRANTGIAGGVCERVGAYLVFARGSLLGYPLEVKLGGRLRVHTDAAEN
jgi:hypothetical protein